MTKQKPQFNPTEEQIQRVLGQTNSDPRKLAIAYLRAQNRAKHSDLAFHLMGDVQDITFAAAIGNVDEVKKAAERGTRRIKAFMEQEKGK